MQHAKEASFDDDDLDTLQGMADLVAIALENARLFTDVQRDAMNQKLITGMGDRLQRAGSVADILALAVRDLGEAYDLEQATICLGSEAELRKAGNEPEPELEEAHHDGVL
jgi:GAF domain-containing protein